VTSTLIDPGIVDLLTQSLGQRCQQTLACHLPKRRRILGSNSIAFTPAAEIGAGIPAPPGKEQSEEQLSILPSYMFRHDWPSAALSTGVALPAIAGVSPIHSCATAWEKRL